ncbi:hypothetical protein [Sphingorhabdus sp. Alg239-R122]|uniref:hypothetical protein n=1 Tax=Sphingorhabdus sp. Alg239-R122 TaxID=2305989 RepID=UPI0013DA4B34|nr:hypothetical protein [Sphingorhabdus sp. Alg239-R122]
MKFEKLPQAAVRSGDCRKMVEAIHRLDELQVDVRRPAQSPYQLKVAEEISFFPRKGTIHIDGETAKREETGLEALIELLNDTGDIPPNSAAAIALDIRN